MEANFSPHFKKTLRYYFNAKQVVINSGYEYEILWQDIVNIGKISAKSFYSEYSWVVLSSGMKERVIREKFTTLTNIFENWEQPFLISANPNKYIRMGLKVFNHEKKMQAIAWMGNYLTIVSVEDEITSIRNNGIKYLLNYPYLGPATSLHFAKNIGFHVSKPDRHLIRISGFLGYTSPEYLCKKISSVIGEKESIVDLVLWRYATLNKDYLS